MEHVASHVMYNNDWWIKQYFCNILFCLFPSEWSSIIWWVGEVLMGTLYASVINLCNGQIYVTLIDWVIAVIFVRRFFLFLLYQLNGKFTILSTWKTSWKKKKKTGNFFWDLCTSTTKVLIILDIAIKIKPGR